MFAAEEFAGQGADEGPEDDAQESLGTERESDDADDEAYVAAPDAGFAAPVFLGAEGGDYVVEDGDDDGDDGGDDEEGGVVVGGGGEVEHQEGCPAEGRAGEAGDDGAGDADEHQKDGEDDEEGVHKV